MTGKRLEGPYTERHQRAADAARREIGVAFANGERIDADTIQDAAWLYVRDFCAGEDAGVWAVYMAEASAMYRECMSIAFGSEVRS